ncbi:transposase [Ralstonia solanacearum]|nr:transposase [Ralstonia solanacearum]OPK45933.1 transposase [Ralstonia solanacearum]OPK50043.1 transposase [Ralstonia solanacearum]OPK51374.1 transposase [Ralstonia solanacearum]OYQ02163.1 transposase [Ralstonia solanacearum]
MACSDLVWGDASAIGIIEASRICTKHPVRVIKRRFGHLLVRCRGLMKNTQQLHTPLALSTPWMTRGRRLRKAKA